MNIVVAGAGAGKTTSMAEVVLQRLKEINKEKIVYIVTYTNSARDRIREKVMELNGSIPKQLHIETYHSFLIQEFIFPFHHLLYQTQYIKASLIKLSTIPAYRNSKIKELEANQEIHVDKVTEVAKWIICGKSADKKNIKIKRTRILSIVSNYLDSIFIDEAQDMDSHLKQIVITLYTNRLQLYIVGDPKQDLRGRNAFNDLITEHADIVEYKEENHRCPLKHVELSNRFIASEQKQVAQADTDGKLGFIFEKDLLIEDYIKNEKWDYVYISKKNERYVTNSEDLLKEESNLTYELKCIIKNSNIKKDKIDLGVFRAKQWCLKVLTSKTNSFIFTEIQRSFNLKLSKKDMAKLGEALKLNREKEQVSGIKVNSIDSIKGLEGKRCLFILTTDLIPYLIQENTANNKMKNYLYVALTRAREELMFLVTREVEEKYSRELLIEKFEELKISHVELEI
ncbi:UvrD-helicase domain-containing protein [Paenisporosarcina sp. NPDC076898]|uniref:UvrD-helicase domain-containing protein n=1 Tax=unclassified Paenisporosarcina TaxID=2642018 RepID=UPI003D07CBD2